MLVRFGRGLRQSHRTAFATSGGKRIVAGGGGPDLGELAAQIEDDSSRQSIMWNAEHDRHVLNHLLGKISERLSEKSVTVFQRIAVNEENAEKVAEELGMTVGAARVAQHRVLRALKELASDLIEV